ncbi:hypothetical protein FSP39_001374 [Pinctada imbricata]|uniref:Uncharacterized protein n=1 Tax=Pinctada imbricata TaxID=66713 RepID=A0AA88Y1P6_PINIB|nr:hypothetical protein FSP39_001374 [Pinctada imbricata]
MSSSISIADNTQKQEIKGHKVRADSDMSSSISIADNTQKQEIKGHKVRADSDMSSPTSIADNTQKEETKGHKVRADSDMSSSISIADNTQTGNQRAQGEDRLRHVVLYIHSRQHTETGNQRAQDETGWTKVPEEEKIPVSDEVDSYGKLVSWLIQMSETDDNDTDTESIQNDKMKRLKPDKKLYGWRQLMTGTSESFESHVSSDTQYWGSTYNKSTASEDVPDIGETNFPSKPSSFEVVENQSSDMLLRVPSRRGVLRKQYSVCDSRSGQETPEIHRSMKSIHDSPTDLKTKELHMLKARLQDLQYRKSKNPEFCRQRSEPCSDRIYKHDHTFLKRQRKATQSFDLSGDRIYPQSKLYSRQTTSDEESTGQTSSSVSGKRQDSELNPELIRLHDFSSTQTEPDPQEDLDNTSIKNRRNLKGKVSSFWSKSVNNLMCRTSRLRASFSRKSNSLFTVQPSYDSGVHHVDMRQSLSEKVLDDKLLDGNIADILFAVDAIWPTSQANT